MPGLLNDAVVLLNGRKGVANSFKYLDRLIRQQAYRLVYWKTGRDEINFRRFFDVNSLVGVRVEVPRVFDLTHALTFSLIHEGKISGLRIDHIDGLYDPLSYLRNVLRRIDEPGGGRPPAFYLAVEKILSGSEHLPANWPVQGTTGYDFCSKANGIFVDPAGTAALSDSYARLTGSQARFSDLVYEKKKQVMDELFPAEINALACRAGELARQSPGALNISGDSFKNALIEITACLPVYRTYVRSLRISTPDRQTLETALREARNKIAGPDECALDFLGRIFLLDFPSALSSEQKKAWRHFMMRWQQVSGPVMAKGMEDTAFYSYNRLISLNEVGADLRLSAIPVDEFHEFNAHRLKRWPHTFNTTSTHDSKRSEDTRARINVLSEIPGEWESHLSRWRALNDPKKRAVAGSPVPEPNVDSLLYQTLIGIWQPSAEESCEFRRRLVDYMLKAVREAKIRTGWIDPDLEYEKALTTFLESILDISRGNEFLDDFIPFQGQVAFYGALNSLSQLLLKITSPGLPDFYQGTELWNFSLVDPDNRRPVDFSRNREYLDAILRRERENGAALIENLENNWEDGRIKLYAACKALNARRRDSELYKNGEYLPLEATGRSQRNVVAFARHWRNRWAMTFVPRLCAGLVRPGKLSVDSPLWGEDFIAVPDGAPRQWRNIFSGTILTVPPAQRLRLADVFTAFPVALLINTDAALPIM
jgi:(1->4)-alpha-D-glucan 1-alpha-D-glucosylmutase